MYSCIGFENVRKFKQTKNINDNKVNAFINFCVANLVMCDKFFKCHQCCITMTENILEKLVLLAWKIHWRHVFVLTFYCLTFRW